MSNPDTLPFSKWKELSPFKKCSTCLHWVRKMQCELPYSKSCLDHNRLNWRRKGEWNPYLPEFISEDEMTI